MLTKYYFKILRTIAILLLRLRVLWYRLVMRVVAPPVQLKAKHAIWVGCLKCGDTELYRIRLGHIDYLLCESCGNSSCFHELES